MASIYARGNILWIKYMLNGTLYQRSTGLPNTREGKKEAEIFRLQTEIELKQKRRRPHSAATISSAWYEFLLFKQNDNRRMDVYRNAFTHFASFINKVEQPVHSVTIDDIKRFQGYLKKQKLSQNTIATYFIHIRTFFNYCVRKNYIQSNPVPRLKRSRIEKRVIPEDTMRHLLWYFKLHDEKQYVCIKLFYLTGFRRGELLSLKGDDIDFNRRIIFVNNTKANRIDKFPVDDELMKFLNSIKIPKGRIIKYKPNGLKFWNRAITKLDFPHYSLHDIRRLYGTRMAHKLMPYELNKLMRHQDMRTTLQFYADVELGKIAIKMNG